MRSRFLSHLALGCLALLPIQSLFASGTATLNVFAHVEESALSLAQAEALNFGSFVPSGADTLILSPDGSISLAAGNLVHSGGQTPGRMLASDGRSGKLARVSFANNDEGILLENLFDPSKTMRVRRFTIGDDGSDTVDNPDFGRLRFDGDGKASFYVGAELEVSNGQEPGLYRGEIQVTVSYD